MNIALFGYVKKILPVLLGAAAGYAYYYYIGCLGGSCPITGNPWTSTAYGAMIGAFLVPWKKDRQTANEERTMQSPDKK